MRTIWWHLTRPATIFELMLSVTGLALFILYLFRRSA